MNKILQQLEHDLEVCKKAVEYNDQPHCELPWLVDDKFTFERVAQHIEALKVAVERIQKSKYHLDREELEGRERGSADEQLDKALQEITRILSSEERR